MVHLLIKSTDVYLFATEKSPAGVLSWLLGNTNSSKMKLTCVTITGHEVHLDVAPVGSDGFRLSVSGSDIRNLVGIHLAVLLRVQVCILLDTSCGNQHSILFYVGSIASH